MDSLTTLIQEDRQNARLRLSHSHSYTNSLKAGRMNLGGMLNNYQARLNTVRTEIGPQLPSFNLPRRLFRWIYSVSLVILVSIIMALIAVTPIDVIVQSADASFSGIKLFIVIIVCVLFLLVSFLLYFLRTYQHRVAMNDIPTHTVYALQQNDLPTHVYQYIEKKLKYCREVKEMAGPLTNENITINYPGIQPPEYIQARNLGNEGNLLPPNLNYEDVIRSFSDRFTILDNFESSIKTPKHFTFKEMTISLMQDLSKNKKIDNKALPNIPKFLSLYEKLKFGGKLIPEKDMVEFMVECIKFTTVILDNYGSVFAIRKKKYRDRPPESFMVNSSRSFINSRSDKFNDSYSGIYNNNTINNKYEQETNNDSDTSVIQTNSRRYSRVTMESTGPTARSGNISTQGSVLKRFNSNSTNGSVIKQKLTLDIDQPRRQSAVMFDLGDMEIKRLNTRGSLHNKLGSHNSSYTGMSGYASEIEDEDDINESMEDGGSIYKFRPMSRNLKQPEIIPLELNDTESNDSKGLVKRNVPTFYLEPSTPEQPSRFRAELPSRIRSRLSSPTKLLDLEIKRLKSPKKRL